MPSVNQYRKQHRKETFASDKLDIHHTNTKKSSVLTLYYDIVLIQKEIVMFSLLQVNDTIMAVQS